MLIPSLRLGSVCRTKEASEECEHGETDKLRLLNESTPWMFDVEQEAEPQQHSSRSHCHQHYHQQHNHNHQQQQQHHHHQQQQQHRNSVNNVNNSNTNRMKNLNGKVNGVAASVSLDAGNSQGDSSVAGSDESELDEDDEREDDDEEDDDDEDDDDDDVDDCDSDDQVDDDDDDHEAGDDLNDQVAVDDETERRTSAEAEAEAKQRMAEKLKNFHNRVAYLNEDGTKRYLFSFSFYWLINFAFSEHCRFDRHSCLILRCLFRPDLK